MHIYDPMSGGESSVQQKIIEKNVISIHNNNNKQESNVCMHVNHPISS